MLNKYFDNIIDKEFITEEIFYGNLLDKWLKSGYEENSITNILILTDDEVKVVNSIRKCIIIPFRKSIDNNSIGKSILKKDGGYEVFMQLFTYSDEENTIAYNPILIINIENIEKFKESSRENYDKYHEIILDTNYIDNIAIEEIMEDDRVDHKIDNLLKEFTGTFTSGATLYYERV